MERKELELFLRQQIKLSRKTTEGKLLFYSGEIRQLNTDSLIFKDKYGQLVLIPYATVEHVQTVRGDFK